MRLYFLSVSFASAFAFSASAADLPIYKAKPAIAPLPTYWAGYYWGAHAGYGKASFDGVFDSSELPGFPQQANFLKDLDVDGFVGGLHAGYNWQTNGYVYGVEADITFTGMKDSHSDQSAGGVDIVEAKMRYLASLRGRLGMQYGAALLYATGGLAYASAKYTAIDDDSFAGSTTLDDFGYVAGGGIEYKLATGWNLRAEGLYYSFDKRADTSTLTLDSDPGDFAELEDVWVARIGLSFQQ